MREWERRVYEQCWVVAELMRLIRMLEVFSPNPTSRSRLLSCYTKASAARRCESPPHASPLRLLHLLLSKIYKAEHLPMRHLGWFVAAYHLVDTHPGHQDGEIQYVIHGLTPQYSSIIYTGLTCAMCQVTTPKETKQPFEKVAATTSLKNDPLLVACHAPPLGLCSGGIIEIQGGEEEKTGDCIFRFSGKCSAPRFYLLLLVFMCPVLPFRSLYKRFCC